MKSSKAILALVLIFGFRAQETTQDQCDGIEDQKEKYTCIVDHFPEQFYQEGFNHFVELFKKSYADEEERGIRYELFVENYKEILVHNFTNSSYKQEVNRFSDLTSEEFEDQFLAGDDFFDEEDEESEESEEYIPELPVDTKNVNKGMETQEEQPIQPEQENTNELVDQPIIPNGLIEPVIDSTTNFNPENEKGNIEVPETKPKKTFEKKIINYTNGREEHKIDENKEDEMYYFRFNRQKNNIEKVYIYFD